MGSGSRSRRRRDGARRGAALVALISVAALGGVVLGLLADAPNLVLSFGYLFVTVLVGWTVLTRRSPLRYLALPVGGLAVLGLAGFAYDHWGLLVVWACVVWLFGASARLALPRPDGAPPAAATDVPPAQRAVLIINPRSGDGTAIRAGLVEQAARRGIQTLELGPDDDLRALAQAAIRGGADVIGMAGGDGSQAVVAAVASQYGRAHVCVPTGTRNHFARDLGLDPQDVVGSLDAFTRAVERRIDLGRVNETVFVNNASLGLYAEVVQAETYRDAKLRTWRRRLPDLAGPDTSATSLRFVGPDGRDWRHASVVLVSNNPYRLQALSTIASRGRLDTGRLGIAATPVRTARAVAGAVTLGAFGWRWLLRPVVRWSATEFVVHAPRVVPVGIDGEAVELAPPLRFTSMPGALRVRLPAEVRPGVSGTEAAPLNRATVRLLVQVAAHGSGPDAG